MQPQQSAQGGWKISFSPIILPAILVNLGKWKWTEMFPSLKPAAASPPLKKPLHGSALATVGAVPQELLQTHLAVTKKKNNLPNTTQNMISRQKSDPEPNVKYPPAVHGS